MAILEASYAKGDAGYNAMISDFSAMFDWDTGDSPTGVPYTDFKKSCGDNTYVALRIMQPSSDAYYPEIRALVNKNGRIIQSTSGGEYPFCSYTSGNGFFVICTSSSHVPNNAASRNIWGISTCRNIITGETGWCVFKVIDGSITVYYDYQMYAKESTKAINIAWAVSPGAKIGGAVSMHDPTTGCVSDKVMVLTAVPDNYTACLASVVFNGVSYNRLGHILVPKE